MHEIVADTAPLNYLVLIEAVGILPRLFASVLIPPAVKKELSHGNAPAAVSTWIANPPSWLKVVNLKTSVVALSHLDDGEAEAIALALEQPGTLLLRRLWSRSPIWTTARQKQSRSRWNSPEPSS